MNYTKRAVASVAVGLAIFSIAASCRAIPQGKAEEAKAKPVKQVIVKEVPVETVAEPTPEPPIEPQFIALPVSMDEATQRMVSEVSGKYSISFSFVIALIETESKCQANVISKTNDYGLMQINKCNHKALSKAVGTTDFLNPRQNVTAGCYILSNLFQKYGEPSMVLMAYNMGEGNAKKLWHRGIWSSAYSQEIMDLEQEYSVYIDSKKVE